MYLKKNEKNDFFPTGIFWDGAFIGGNQNISRVEERVELEKIKEGVSLKILNCLRLLRVYLSILSIYYVTKTVLGKRAYLFLLFTVKGYLLHYLELLKKCINVRYTLLPRHSRIAQMDK